MGLFLVLSSPKIKVNGNKENPIQAGLLMPRPSQTESLLTCYLEGKKPPLVEVLPEGKGNIKWVVGGFTYDDSYYHVTRQRTEYCNSFESFLIL